MTEENKVVDLATICEAYEGKWVAILIDEGSVLCAGDTLEEVTRGSDNYRGERPTVYKVPNKDTPQLL